MGYVPSAIFRTKYNKQRLIEFTTDGQTTWNAPHAARSAAVASTGRHAAATAAASPAMSYLREAPY